MRETVLGILDALAEARSAAYCRLVETRGSTPQKAGAAMLVHSDGSQIGTLGGGCVEAEVKRRALAALQAGRTEIPVFQLDSDYGWDDGLICGGRMQVLIQPLDRPGVEEYFQRLAELLQRGDGFVEAVALDGAAELEAGSSYLLDEESRLLARIGEPVATGTRLPSPPDMSRRPKRAVVDGVAYLPTLARRRLLIVGAGHVGLAVAGLAASVDFDVWIADDREDLLTPERFPMAERLVSGPIETSLPDLEVDARVYCLIVTRGHQHDEQALHLLCDRGAGYVGLIGSRRKIRLIFEDLLQHGVSPETLASVHAPLGVEIGSRTVPEIAVSICAELIAHRNLGCSPARPRGVDPFQLGNRPAGSTSSCEAEA